MTHFIGTIIVPSNIPTALTTVPTKYPYMYGSKAKEWVPGTQLNDYLDKILEPFSESREVYIWQPKDELIAKAREKIENYRNGLYSEYLKDPDLYEAGVKNNPRHIEYLRNDFPKKLEWTDEEVYQNEVLKWEEPKNIRESDGAVLTEYNPKSRWDWWVVGGRWESQYAERQGESVGEFRKEIDETLKKIQAGESMRPAPDNPDDPFEQQDKDRLLPWWFPHDVVVQVDEISVDPATLIMSGVDWHRPGEMGWWGMKHDELTETQWVEKLQEVLSDVPDDFSVVYVDFHI